MAAGTLAAVGLVALPVASSPASASGNVLNTLRGAMSKTATGPLSGTGKLVRTAHGGARLVPQSVDSTGKTTVYVAGSDDTALTRAVRGAGGTVTGSLPGLVQADIPASALTALAHAPGVRGVRPPDRLVPASVTSEGVAAAGADTWQSIGTGAGVKIGIVDVGFGGLADAQASGDLPPTGAGLSVTAEAGCADVNADAHGTAVAEIVHDMAPDAGLVLVCISNTMDVGAAATFLHDQGVSVVNMSLSDVGSLVRGDGTGPLGDIIKRSRQQGLLWVVAAGNQEEDHFRGRAADPNGDGFIEFQGVDEIQNLTIPANEIGAVELSWDQWPTTQNDMIIAVMDRRRLPNPDGPDADLVAVISNDGGKLTGFQAPDTGLFTFDNSKFADPWNLFLEVFNVNAPASTTFDLNAYGVVSPLQYHNAGSITEPATSPYAMAVGAVCVNDGSLEPYSSQGPTIDGRTKPDIAAFDGVSTTTFGSETPGAGCQNGFRGTSGAAPHVAGAAALVKSANPSFDAAQIEDYLESHATPAGPANQFGHGVLNMGPQQVPQPRAGATYQPLDTPQRILDTRTSTGGHQGAVGPGEIVTLSVPAPAGATAVAINLTSTGATSQTHLDVFPETYTGTSTLNLTAGQTAAVFTMVALGPNNTIRIRNAFGQTHAIVDLMGSFVPTGGSTFVPKDSPTRLLDTRTSVGGHLGKLGPGETYALPVRGVAGVPADATAVILNITGVNQTSSTHLDLAPGTVGSTSTLNLDASALRSNVTAVGIGADGKVRIRNAFGSVDAIVDLAGWFVPSGGSRFVALDPTTRILDTRSGNGLHLGPLAQGTSMVVQGSEIYGVPYNATAIAFNLTAVAPTARTFLTVWPTGTTRPSTSNINLLAGQVVPNAVVTGTGTNGTVALFNNAGRVHLVADIYGYFAP